MPEEFRLSLKYLVSCCHLVPWVGKERKIDRFVLRKPLSGQIRRVGTDGNHSCTNLVEERQIPVDLVQMPGARFAPAAEVKDQDDRPVIVQLLPAPNLAIGIGEFEIGCLMAQERVAMGWDRIPQ